MSQKFYNLNPRSYLSLIQAQKPKPISPFDFKRSLKKALSGSYYGLLFDESFLKSKNLDLFFKQSLKAHLKPALQVLAPSFKNKKKDLLRLKKLYGNSVFFNIIFEQEPPSIEDLKPFFPSIFFTRVVTKKNKNSLFKYPKEVYEKTEFYFPYKKNFFDPFLTPRQVYHFIQKQGPLKPCLSEIYDSRIAEDMDLEPLFLPFAENKIPSNQKIFFSLIIPSYNNKEQLLNTLKNLTRQNYPRTGYEVILVDDGSLDNTKQAVKSFMKNNSGLNLKAFFFPRVVERKIGDSRFRAGLARNLGAKHSQGEIIAFLDADILVPQDYLQKLQSEHKKADLILLKRRHLKPKAPLKDGFFDPQGLKKWSYILQKNYWGAFYKKGFEKVKSPWKYVCTYGLSLPKKDFQAVGAFGKNFTSYGFEDVDLGYRLWKTGKKFLLSDIEVYHQAPPKEQNQSFQNPLYRYKQLSKTAKIFFYKHLDPEIYREMKNYMSQRRDFHYFFPFL